MPAIDTIKGVLKTFLWITKGEWDEMDHKFYRLASAAVMFVLVGLFWFYFLRNILPTPF